MNKVKTTTDPCIISKIPFGLDGDDYNNIVFEVCELFKTEELTVKQAQSVLHCCEEMLLESMVNV